MKCHFCDRVIVPVAPPWRGYRHEDGRVFCSLATSTMATPKKRAA